MEDLIFKIGYFIGKNIFWIIGLTILFFIVRGILKEKPTEEKSSDSAEDEYYPEIENDPAYIEALKQAEQEKNIQPQQKEIIQEVKEELPTPKTPQQLEFEAKEKEYNRKQSIVIKIILILFGIFILFRIGQVVFKPTPEKDQSTPPLSITAASSKSSTESYDTLPKSNKKSDSSNYKGHPENEFKDNKLQYYNTENKIPNIKISLSLPKSWMIKPPRYAETLNSFFSGNEVDNVNCVLSVYTLNISSVNLTTENLNSQKGLTLLYNEMTSSFTKRKLISTSTNDKLGNYNASSIVYTLVSDQKMADGKFVASISKNYFIQLQTKVISFVETYSDSPTISAPEMKKKYSELSRLILNTFKIEKE